MSLIGFASLTARRPASAIASAVIALPSRYCSADTA